LRRVCANFFFSCSIAPNAFSQLRARLRGLIKRSKKDDKQTETTKPADTAVKPTEAAAVEADTDPVAAAARKYFAVLPACDPQYISIYYIPLFSSEDSGKLWFEAGADPVIS